jgi:biopolymer transport protein ExbB/TolQ
MIFNCGLRDFRELVTGMILPALKATITGLFVAI